MQAFSVSFVCFFFVSLSLSPTIGRGIEYSLPQNMLLINGKKKLNQSQQTYLENGFYLNPLVKFIESLLLLACDHVEQPEQVEKALVL